MNPWCVQEYELRLGKMGNPQDAMAGGLGLFRCDGDFLAQELVQKRGFAHIRCPNDTNVTRPERRFFAHRMIAFPHHSDCDRRGKSRPRAAAIAIASIQTAYIRKKPEPEECGFPQRFVHGTGIVLSGFQRRFLGLLEGVVVGIFRQLVDRGKRPSGEQLVETAHLAIVETFPFVQERTRLLEEPLSSRTPEIFLERFITSRWLHLFPTTPAKRDRIIVRFDLPDAHGRPFFSHPDWFLNKGIKQLMCQQ